MKKLNSPLHWPHQSEKVFLQNQRVSLWSNVVLTAFITYTLPSQNKAFSTTWNLQRKKNTQRLPQHQNDTGPQPLKVVGHQVAASFPVLERKFSRVQDMAYAKRMSPLPPCGYSATALAASCGLTNSTLHRSLPLYAIDRMPPSQPVQSESKNFQFQKILMTFFLEAATRSGPSTELIAYIAIDKIIRKNLTCLSRFCNLFFHRRVQTAFSDFVERSTGRWSSQCDTYRGNNNFKIMLRPNAATLYGNMPETCLRAFCGKWRFGSSEGAIWPGILLQTQATDWLPGC